jgi:L-seryl-tRNA(Ser) seleniumtransferase
MAESGAIMVEVGTTNRTRLSDYEQAITGKTGVLFKAHRSNFTIEGFTEEVSVADMAALSREQGFISVFDLGSGLLKPDGRREPDVASALAARCDLITFSGDKLLGGPQAGIIIGRADLIEQLHRNPLYRALRVDKLTLTALAAVLTAHWLGRADSLPVPHFLHRDTGVLESLARRLIEQLVSHHIECRMVATEGRFGGGAMPGEILPSRAVVIPAEHPAAWLDRLRRQDIPVVAILREGELCIDLLAVDEDEIDSIAQAVIQAR